MDHYCGWRELRGGWSGGRTVPEGEIQCASKGYGAFVR